MFALLSRFMIQLYAIISDIEYFIRYSAFDINGDSLTLAILVKTLSVAKLKRSYLITIFI